MEYEVWKITDVPGGEWSFEVVIFAASIDDYIELTSVHLSNDVKTDLWLVIKEDNIIKVKSKFKNY
jgi:hypothetical protein